MRQERAVIVSPKKAACPIFLALYATVLTGCMSLETRIEQQRIAEGLFVCSSPETCQLYARTSEDKWGTFILSDSTWKPTGSGRGPRRIIIPDEEHEWWIQEGRLYGYDKKNGWQIVETCLQGQIVDLFFRNNKGWVITDQGTLGVSTDGGKRWTPNRLNIEGALSSLFFLDQSNGWMVLNGQFLLRTQDGGMNWSRIGDAVSQSPITQIYFGDLSQGWAVVQDSKSPLLTTDGGLTWTPPGEPNQDLKSIYYFNRHQGWGIHPGTGILHTSDGGKTWTLQEVDLPWLWGNRIGLIWDAPLYVAGAVAYVVVLPGQAAVTIIALPVAALVAKAAPQCR
jgi:hypothetical protein